jgi:hypothetical protein
MLEYNPLFVTYFALNPIESRLGVKQSAQAP